MDLLISLCSGCEAITKTSCSDLSPLGPERRVQLAVGKEAVLQAGEELEQVSSPGEAQGRSLDSILTDQHHRPPTVHYRKCTGNESFIIKLFMIMYCWTMITFVCKMLDFRIKAGVDPPC